MVDSHWRAWTAVAPKHRKAVPLAQAPLIVLVPVLLTIVKNHVKRQNAGAVEAWAAICAAAQGPAMAPVKVLFPDRRLARLPILIIQRAVRVTF
jgi:hypothetical protein